MCQQRDVGVAKMSAAGQDAAEQNGSVDRRHLGIPYPVSGVNVRPVIEEAAVMNEFTRKKFQGGDDSLASVGMRNEAALVTDADCS